MSSKGQGTRQVHAACAFPSRLIRMISRPSRCLPVMLLCIHVQLGLTETLVVTFSATPMCAYNKMACVSPPSNPFHCSLVDTSGRSCSRLGQALPAGAKAYPSTPRRAMRARALLKRRETPSPVTCHPIYYAPLLLTASPRALVTVNCAGPAAGRAAPAGSASTKWPSPPRGLVCLLLKPGTSATMNTLPWAGRTVPAGQRRAKLLSVMRMHFVRHQLCARSAACWPPAPAPPAWPPTWWEGEAEAAACGVGHTPATDIHSEIVAVADLQVRLAGVACRSVQLDGRHAAGGVGLRLWQQPARAPRAIQAQQLVAPDGNELEDHLLKALLDVLAVPALGVLQRQQAHRDVMRQGQTLLARDPTRAPTGQQLARAARAP